MNENTWSGVPEICAGISPKLKVPVVPYNREIPNNNKPDEKAEEMIILNAASDDFFIKIKIGQRRKWYGR